MSEFLTKIVAKRTKRIGQGQGSGRGKTGGRGTKGQNARVGLPITHPHYEGGQRSLIKRLPTRRGKGNSPISKKPIVVNFKDINYLPDNVDVVDLEALIKYRIVDPENAKVRGVKILGNGVLKKSFNIKLPMSKSAAAKIEKRRQNTSRNKVKDE